MSTEGMSARELLLSRERWLRVAEIDGDIFLRIDGRYSYGLGADMVEHWAQVLREVLAYESDQQLADDLRAHLDEMKGRHGPRANQPDVQARA